MASKTYEGIDEDKWGGMTQFGAIIKDAWVFGLIADTETGKGWDMGRLTELYGRVHDEWAKYGFKVNNLPDELRERHARIHGEAIKRARELGWDPELGDDD